MSVGKILNGFIVLIGLWEIIAPFVLGYPAGSFAFWNTLITGVLLVILGALVMLTRDRTFHRILDWLVALVGIWLLSAPFIFGFSYNTLTLAGDATIAGVLVIFLGALAAIQFGLVQPYPSRPREQVAGEIGPVYGRGEGSQAPIEALNPSAQLKAAYPAPALIPDDELRHAVIQHLDKNWQLSPSTIQVEVHDGVVTLRGEVDTVETRQLAQETVETMTGVRLVQNELTTPS